MEEGMPPSGDDVSAPSADRKIWMRSCNQCGRGLHVRRTRCTDCGSVQASKRAIATIKAEADRVAAAAIDADRLRQEAEEAANQLTRINGTRPPAGAGDSSTSATAVSPDDALVLLAAAPHVPVADGVAQSGTSAPAAAAVAQAKATAIADALAGLSPVQLIKLRRMRKLRALLSKMPADIAASEGAASSSDLAVDAISMLASVACSS